MDPTFISKVGERRYVMTQTSLQKKIVVGVDGSDSSKEALKWAISQAQLSGDTLEAVIAYDIPMAAYGGLPNGFDLGTHSRNLAEKTVAEVIESTGAHLEIPIKVIENNPSVALLKASESADLLVIGSSGHGPFAGTLLGSVAQRCVHHASCPVVVVRHRQDKKFK